jgi:hypothetical protein
MSPDLSSMRLRLRELEGRIRARRQLANGSPERQWHLEYVEIYTEEMQKLHAQLQSHGLTLHNQRDLLQTSAHV